MFRSHRRCRPILIALLVLVAAPMLAQAGSLPHRHDSATPAFFNQEHDLTLLATGGAVAVHDAAPILFAIVLIATLSLRRARRPAARPSRGADSRAPPVH